jgi:hypothetical protein
VATLGHDHHREPETLFAEAGCDDQRTHLASHEGTDLSNSFSECPICQYRTGPQIEQTQVSFIPDAAATGELAVLSEPDAVVRELRWVATRGPPRA